MSSPDRGATLVSRHAKHSSRNARPAVTNRASVWPRVGNDTLINHHADEDEAPAWTNPDGRLTLLLTGGHSISV